MLDENEKPTTSKNASHTKINTPLENKSNQPLLGQDGHDQLPHGLPDSNFSGTHEVISKHLDVVTASDGEVRNKTTKEKLRYTLLNTEPKYDK